MKKTPSSTGTKDDPVPHYRSKEEAICALNDGMSIRYFPENKRQNKLILDAITHSELVLQDNTKKIKMKKLFKIIVIIAIVTFISMWLYEVSEVFRMGMNNSGTLLLTNK